MRCDRCAIHSAGDRPLGRMYLMAQWSAPGRGNPPNSRPTLDLCVACAAILSDWWEMACEVFRGVDASRLSKAMLSEMNINSPIPETDTDE